jgi:hypothetical protein
VLFELLRYSDGSFVFDSDVNTEVTGDHRDNVEEALADAEEQLREWREIEAVIPSPSRRLTLVADRSGKDITLNAKQWSAVVALGTGCDALTLASASASPNCRPPGSFATLSSSVPSRSEPKTTFALRIPSLVATPSPLSRRPSQHPRRHPSPCSRPHHLRRPPLRLR